MKTNRKRAPVINRFCSEPLFYGSTLFRTRRLESSVLFKDWFLTHDVIIFTLQICQFYSNYSHPKFNILCNCTLKIIIPFYYNRRKGNDVKMEPNAGYTGYNNIRKPFWIESPNHSFEERAMQILIYERSLEESLRARHYPQVTVTPRRPGMFETTRDVTVSGGRWCKWRVNKIRLSENTLSFTNSALGSQFSAFGTRPSHVYRIT